MKEKYAKSLATLKEALLAFAKDQLGLEYTSMVISPKKGNELEVLNLMIYTLCDKLADAIIESEEILTNSTATSLEEVLDYLFRNSEDVEEDEIDKFFKGRVKLC